MRRTRKPAVKITRRRGETEDDHPSCSSSRRCPQEHNKGSVHVEVLLAATTASTTSSNLHCLLFLFDGAHALLLTTGTVYTGRSNHLLTITAWHPTFHTWLGILYCMFVQLILSIFWIHTDEDSSTVAAVVLLGGVSDIRGLVPFDYFRNDHGVFRTFEAWFRTFG